MRTGSDTDKRLVATSSRLPASDMGRRAFAIFTRLVDVFVGLVNLLVLTDPNSVVAAYQKRNVGRYEALPPVLAVGVAGLATSEVVLRRLKPAALRVLVLGPDEMLVRIPVSFIPGLVGPRSVWGWA